MTTKELLLAAYKSAVEEQKQTRNRQLPGKIKSLLLTSFPKKEVLNEIEAIDKGTIIAKASQPQQKYKTVVLSSAVKKNHSLTIKGGNVAVIEENPPAEKEERIKRTQIQTGQKLNMFEQMAILTDEEVFDKFKTLAGLKEYIDSIFGVKLSSNHSKKKTIITFREELTKKIKSLKDESGKDSD